MFLENIKFLRSKNSWEEDRWLNVSLRKKRRGGAFTSRERKLD